MQQLLRCATSLKKKKMSNACMCVRSAADRPFQTRKEACFGLSTAKVTYDIILKRHAERLNRFDSVLQEEKSVSVSTMHVMARQIKEKKKNIVPKKHAGSNWPTSLDVCPCACVCHGTTNENPQTIHHDKKRQVLSVGWVLQKKKKPRCPCLLHDTTTTSGKNYHATTRQAGSLRLGSSKGKKAFYIYRLRKLVQAVLHVGYRSSFVRNYVILRMISYLSILVRGILYLRGQHGFDFP